MKSFSNKFTYFYNKKKKTTTCVVSDCASDFFDFCKRNCPKGVNEDALDIMIHIALKNMYLYPKDTFRATAYCCAEDEYDEDIGRDIARLKALSRREKYFLDLFSKLTTYFKTLYTFIGIKANDDSHLKKYTSCQSLILDQHLSLNDIKSFLKDKSCAIVGHNCVRVHACSQCDKTFVNYLNDVDFEKHELEWHTFSGNNDCQHLELCDECFKSTQHSDPNVIPVH